MLEQLPGRVFSPLRCLAAQLRGKIGHRLAKRRVSIAAFQKFDEMRAQSLVVFHSFLS